MRDAVVLRSRRPADLDACVEALREVHDADGYPLRWPPDPHAWLTPPRLLRAWVAELPDGTIAGHVAIQHTSPADPTSQPLEAGTTDPTSQPLDTTTAGPGSRTHSATAVGVDSQPLDTTATNTHDQHSTPPSASAHSQPLDTAASNADGHPLGGAVEVSRLFVIPGARRHGVGTALLREVRSWAAAHRGRLVLDVVDGHRSGAVAFYEGGGWRHTRTTDAEWTTSGGGTVRLRHYVLGDDGQ